MIGPSNFKVITPTVHPEFGINGWEPSTTVKYDLGDGFKLVKELDLKDTEVEIAV